MLPDPGKQWQGIHLNSNVSSVLLLGESAPEAQRGSGLGCAWPGGQGARLQVTFRKRAKGADGDRGFEDTQNNEPAPSGHALGHPSASGPNLSSKARPALC